MPDLELGVQELKVNLKKVKDCTVLMSVEVEADAVENRYLEVLRDFQRQARLPGFREGKAPMDMVEKRYAQEAREEFLKAYIPEIYYRTVQEQKVSPVSLPKISDIRYERGQKLQFSAHFEESPKVSLKHYKGIKLKRESADVTEADVQEAVKSLLDSRANYTPITEKRAVADGDHVSVDIELWKDGVFVPGRTGVLLSVKPGGDDDFYTKIVGATEGAALEIQREGKPFTRVTLRQIHDKKAAEMNDDLAKSFGKEDVAALMEAIRKDIVSHKQSQVMEKMKHELFEKLLTLTDFTLPESLLAKQKERLFEQAHQRFIEAGMPEQEWDQEKAGLEAEFDKKAKDQVKLYFILQHVAGEEDIELDEIEFDKRLQALADQSQQPLEEVRRVFEDDLRESMREKKTVDFLIANAKFEEEK